MQTTSTAAGPEQMRCHDPALSTRPSGSTVTVGSWAIVSSIWRCCPDTAGDAVQLAGRDAVAGPGIGVVEEPGPGAGRLPRPVERTGRSGACCGRCGWAWTSPSRWATWGWPTRNKQSASVGGEAGQIGVEAIQQFDPAARATPRQDRDAGLALAPRHHGAPSAPTPRATRASSRAVVRPPRWRRSNMSSTVRPASEKSRRNKTEDVMFGYGRVPGHGSRRHRRHRHGGPTRGGLTTPPGTSPFEAYRDPDADPPGPVVQVGQDPAALPPVLHRGPPRLC